MKEKEPNTDPFEIASSIFKVCESWMKDTDEWTNMLFALSGIVKEVNTEEANRFLEEGRCLGNASTDEKALTLEIVKSNSKAMRKYFSLYARWMKDFVEKAPDLDEREKKKSLFWIKQLVSLMAPSNFFWTNPGAVQRFMESSGESLKKGLDNLSDDMARGDNQITLVDRKAHKVGESLAITPGSVVYRNGLMELLQYEPSTDKTFATPIVLVLPWINKYYIFDLEKHNSLVRWLVNEGFTVFTTSWKNPTAEMRETTFEDYMFNGVKKGVEVALSICRKDKAHVAGYCIGGTALSALMAWFNAGEETSPIAHFSLFATLVDFSEPGELGLFTGDKGIDFVESLMEADGYLDGKYLGQTFRLLKSDSLIWRSYVNNYLYGEAPSSSAMLFWNCDSTRLPEKMGSYYLREMYLKNNLAKADSLVMRGRSIDMGRITQPLFAVGAKQDHISPWEGTFKICNLVKGDVNYLLASEGHIAGIVNPPSPKNKKRYWSAPPGGEKDPDAWFSHQKVQRGSWWKDWSAWLSERSGPPEEPPGVGAGSYPPLDKAPGLYVFEK